MWTGFNPASAEFTSSKPIPSYLPSCGGDRIYIGLRQFSNPSFVHDSSLSFSNNLLVVERKEQWPTLGISTQICQLTVPFSISISCLKQFKAVDLLLF